MPIPTSLIPPTAETSPVELTGLAGQLIRDNNKEKAFLFRQRKAQDSQFDGERLRS